MDRRTQESTIDHPRAIRLTRAAESDFAEIWFYAANEACTVIPDRLLDGLAKTWNTLADTPFIGASRPHRPSDLRVLFHQPYAIHHPIFDTEIIIVRVLHGARDIARIFPPE
ncbi:MAG: type II toxin-antitoxin system RelE/ParE family toxin [Burkholderiales bacterium]|nr:type II toxin-antitoxin system RelE/ParE family toxin [Burkholderiales bacterium]